MNYLAEEDSSKELCSFLTFAENRFTMRVSRWRVLSYVITMIFRVFLYFLKHVLIWNGLFTFLKSYFDLLLFIYPPLLLSCNAGNFCYPLIGDQASCKFWNDNYGSAILFQIFWLAMFISGSAEIGLFHFTDLWKSVEFSPKGFTRYKNLLKNYL